MENLPQSTMSKAELRQIKKQATKRISWEKYKVKYNEQRKEKTQCECGAIVNRSHLSEHKTNSKHSKNLIQYKIELLEILEDAFGSNIAVSVLSFLG